MKNNSNLTKARFFQTNRYGQTIQQFTCNTIEITSDNWANVIVGLIKFMAEKFIDARKARGRKAWDSSPIFLLLQCGEINFCSVFEPATDHPEYRASNPAQRLKFESSIKQAFAAKFFSNARCMPYDHEVRERELMNEIKIAKEKSQLRNEERKAAIIEHVLNTIKNLPAEIAEKSEVSESNPLEVFSENGKEIVQA
jgi:hypothetical protein